MRCDNAERLGISAVDRAGFIRSHARVSSLSRPTIRVWLIHKKKHSRMKLKVENQFMAKFNEVSKRKRRCTLLCVI